MSASQPLPAAPSRAAAAIDALLWLGVAAGVVARVVRYLDARSLWGDEAQLALNLLGRSAAGLLEPLDFAQSAPVGFLLLEHAIARVFGPSELALRALPLAASLAALPLFHRLARQLLPERDARVALFLFAIADPLVFYASELKQYGFEVLVVLALALALLRAHREPLGGWRAVGLAIAGALAPWFANPAALLCAAGGALLAISAWRRGDRVRLARLCAVGAVWIAGFAVLYATGLRADLGNPYLREFWREGFAPMPPRGAGEWLWYPRTALGFFRDPLGFAPALPAAALAAAGLGRLLRERPFAAGLLLGTAALGLAASMAGVLPLRTWPGVDVRDRLYPYEGRIWLFFAPFALLLVARGIGWLRERSGSHGEWVAAAALALVCALPLRQLVHNTLDPPRVQELRPVLEALRSRVEPGDRVWVMRGSEPVFEYYARRLRLPVRAKNVGVMKPEHVAELERDIAALEPGARVWLVGVHHPAWDSAENQRGIVRRLRWRARPLDVIDAPRAGALLFEVPRPRETPPRAPHPLPGR